MSAPSRWASKVLACQLRGNRVGHVLCDPDEVSYVCLRCNKPSPIPTIHPEHRDAWGSCQSCGQVAVFEWNPETPTQAWFRYADTHKALLREFIRVWHPESNAVKPKLRITAPNAEIACAHIRSMLKKEGLNSVKPEVRFDQALVKRDVVAINGLLNSAWFGVPESTSAWQIEGFKEAVHLMEDVPWPTSKEATT